ncbi:cation:proton antiporter [Candidatus Cloacimonadota bacterium]
MVDDILLKLALIIVLSKILGAVSRKLKQPPVIGMLLLGIVLGPTVFHLIEPCEIILWIGKIGVLFLLFEAGMETDIKKIKRESGQAIMPAAGGIILPFMLGFLFSYFVHGSIITSLVMGVIFTATSVSVSVMTLMDIGKLNSLEGRCIVNAAIIDDIVGIMLLTVIFGFSVDSGSGSGNIFIPFIKIILFFLIVIVTGMFFIRPLFQNLKKLLMDNAVISLTIAILLVYAWFAEVAGLAAITGAYFAGLFIGQTDYKNKIHEGVTIIGKSFFVDVFFVGIGLEFNLFDLNADPIYLLVFVVLAVLGKFIGSGLGSRLTGFDSVRSFRIGSGMIPRGEVALIVANMALEKNIISSEILSATIIMVIVSALFTPVLLKFGYAKLIRKSF